MGDAADAVREAAVPHWQRALEAIDAGDAETARRELHRQVERFRGLQAYSIEWITSLLSFIGRELGEEAVERALRRFGDDYLDQRRAAGDDAPDWNDLPAEARAKSIVRAMVANGATVEVDEDDDKLTLAFRCGTGGRLIDDGRYDEQGGPYLTLRERGPVTFDQDTLPVYCAHCSVNNEMQAIERTGRPLTVEFPSGEPGDVCVHHLYKDTADIPAAIYERLGETKPES